MPGFTRDGHDFAPDAVARGAAALVVAAAARASACPRSLVDDVRAAMAVAAARFYGDPTARLRVAGITGTNGKTTTAFLVRALLEARRASVRPARHGRLGRRRGRSAPVVRTTPEAIDLQRTFREMLDARRRAPARWRSPRTRSSCGAPTAIHVAAAVFTNLTQDHLDFHPTMEDYFQAKRRLFASPLTDVRIVNADDPLRPPAGRGVPGHA